MRAPLKWISLDMLDESKVKDIQLFRLTKTKTLSDKKRKVIGIGLKQHS